MSTLWDTNTGEIVRALSSERRAAGALATGLVLTLVLVVDERRSREAIAAATEASMSHPARLLTVIRTQPDAEHSRLDAEVQVGGGLGPGEMVLLRMQGRLALHAESVVLPLLAPDTPVMTWWYGEPPQQVGADPLGRLATRRLTDCAAAPDPLDALADRARNYVPGDTDLSWTRLTPWRSLLAAAFDSLDAGPLSAEVHANPNNPSALLLAGWLHSRLSIPVAVRNSRGPGITEAQVQTGNGPVAVSRPDGTTATFSRPTQEDRQLPLPRRDLPDLVREELGRLDADEPYAEALSCAAALLRPSPDGEPALANA